MCCSPPPADPYAAPPPGAVPPGHAGFVRVLDEVYGPLLADYASALANGDLDALAELNDRLDVAIAALRAPSFPAGPAPSGTTPHRAQDVAAALARMATLWREIAGTHVREALVTGRPGPDVSGTSTSTPRSPCVVAATPAGSSPWSCP